MSANFLRLAFACAALSLGLASSASLGAGLDQNCVVNVLNRTVQVSPQGGWSMPNVPSNMGRVRARATCTQGTETVSGQSDYFNVVLNGITAVGDIKFEAQEPVPVSIAYSDSTAATLTTIGATLQLTVRATYPDGSIADVTPSAKGTNYSSTNAGIATVSAEGLVTARSSGTVLITARKDEVVAIRQIVVNAGGDKDGDGLPDDFEQANGLNPNDPIDAQEDQDNDGLTALREFQLGTQLRNSDSDSDGLSDGEEVAAGTDGFVTNPLSADTDGDGLRDRVEVLAGSSPTDPNDRNLAGALDRITVNPPTAVLTFNTINTEVSTQLTVTGVLIDGSTLNLTAKSTGTTYTSSNLNVVSFGLTDGEIFAGTSGTATVTVANSGKQFVVSVTVESFQPVVLSAINIPGYANNVDVAGDYAFVAAGASGLQVVDVSDRKTPAIVASLDTDGTAIDIRVFGNYAYIADGTGGLKVVNISNPLAPALAASVDTAGVAQDIKIDSQFAYVADGTNGVEIFDVKNPASPVLKGHLDGIGEVKGIDAEGNRAVAVAGSSLYVLDVTDRAAPLAVGTVSIGPVKDVVMNGNYAYVAAYSSGYRVVRITNPAAPVITGGDASIAPRDVELADNFAFFAEQLFPNVVAYVNVQDPEDPVFQGTINLAPFGDYAGTGISLDGSYAYITEESYVVSQDYAATGTTRLFIAQYRLINDTGGVAPEVTINTPTTQTPVVEGTTLTVDVTATDDIGVRAVTFSVDGVVVATDTTRPFQMPVAIPYGKTSIAVAATAIDFGGNTKSAQVAVPVLKDTDRDGLGDERETAVHHTNPNDPDTDDDGLNDGQEITLGTNPLSADSDGDGRNDLQEVNAGTDPLNPDITPPTVAQIVPANNATGVPENGAVTVTFSELIQPKSINANTLKLMLNGGAVAGTVRLMPNGVDVTFTPTGLLNDFTLYDVVVSGVKDMAGNPMAANFESRYTTGNVVDTTPPTISVSNPVNGATGVPTNAIVSILMSEPIDPLSVTSSSFYITDSQGSIDGIGTLSDDARTLVFVPNIALAVRRQHIVRLTGIKDLFGNSTNTSISFTTDFAADATPPQVLATSLLNGATGIPTNATISVRFNEAINRLAVGGITLKQGANSLSVQRQFSTEGGGTVVELVPNQPLAANTSYTFTIGAVEDLSGNVLGLPVNVSFTTGAGVDTTAPTALWRTPASGASNVPRNTQIEAMMSERINPVSVHSDSFRIYNAQTGVFVPGTTSVGADGVTLRFAPSAPLAANTTYYFYLTYSTYIEDLAGNRYSGTTTFTTGSGTDTTAPVIQLQSIADGAAGVPVNGRLVLTFDAPLADRCVNTQTVRLTSGGVPVVGTITLSSDRQQLTFVPQGSLAANTAYTLNVQGVCDLAGNTLPTFTSGFTTSAVATADTTRPTVTITPAQGATNVPATTEITFTFSEPIDVTTLAGGIQVSVSGLSGEVAGSISVAGNVVTFTPLQPLPGNKVISVIANTVLDLAGNSVIAVSRSFTTGAPSDTTAPQIISVVPNDGLIDVQPGTPVVLTFSESLDASTINADSFAFFVNGSIVSPSVSRSQDNRTVVLTANLPASSIVTVIATSDVTDLSGNPLADFVSAFTTSVAQDGSRPSVVSQYPGSGSSNVLPDAPIALYTNKAMTLGTLQAAMHVSQNGVLVQGTVTPVGNGQALSFRPTQPWARGALVEVYLDSNALDTQGNPLNNYQGSFRVAVDPATVPPTILAFSGQSATGGVPINPMLDILFSEPMNAATVNSTTVVLRAASTGVIVPTTLSLINGGQIVRVQPTAPLVPNQQHYIQVLSTIADTNGMSKGSTQNLFFNTSSTVTVADTLGPKVLSMSPPNGSTNVGVNAQVHVRFDEAVNPLTLNPTPQQTSFGSIFWDNANSELRFVRHQPYAASTQITESVAGIQDNAGNAVSSPNSTTFTTGTASDTVAPTIVESTPFSGATNVPVNAVVRQSFNEQLDPVSINSTTVYLYDSQVGTYESTATLEPDGRTITIVPAQAYLVGRNYTVYMYGVRDLSGNLTNVARSFVTAFAPDTQAPTLVATSVVEGLSGVPTNTVLQARFSEPINPMKLGDVVLRRNGLPVPATVEASGDHLVITFRLVQPLLANAGYVMTVAGIEDLSGNPLGAAGSVSFTTGAGADLQAPTIVSRTPISGATNVPRNPQIEVQFNKRINPVSLVDSAQRLYDSATGNFISGTRTLSADGTSLRFIPSETLAANRTYYFYVAYNTYTEDIAGNRLSGSWTFTTGAATDSIAPQVLMQSIANGAVNVPVNGRIVLRFDAPLADRCVNGQTLQLKTGGVTVAGTLTLTSDRTQVTFTPQAALAVNTAYTLQVQGLCDLAGNSLNNFTTGFTTSASATADTTRPSVTIVPAQGATNVPVTSPIVFTFNEPIDVTTLASGIQVTVSGFSGEVAGDLSVNGNVVTFSPLNPLPGSRTVSVTVNGVYDLAGNLVNGLTRSFTTGIAGDVIAPTVISISPGDGMVDVAQGTPIVITFSESLDASTVDSGSLALFINGEITRPSVSRSQDSRSVILTSSLPASSVISVIATSDLTDLSGNHLAEFVSAFTTGPATDTTRPRVVTQFPPSGASGVRPDVDLFLYVSEPLSASSVPPAVHVSQNGAVVTGTATLISGDQVIRFHPNQPFALNSLVEVFVDANALDSEGNTFQNYSGSFRTVIDPATQNPVLVGFAPTFPSALTGGVPINVAIDAAFSEPLNASTVNSTNVRLIDYPTGQAVAANVSVGPFGQIVRVKPTANLTPNRQYYVQYTNGLRDLNGQAPATTNQFFTTSAVTVADTAAPHVTSVSPPDGATGVALNGHSHWRFDEPINPFSWSISPITIPFTFFWSDNNRDLRVLPHQPLEAGVQVTENLVSAQDYAGNALVGPASHTFTTGSSPDVTVPTPVESSPANAATGVPVNPVTRVRFNEQIDPASVNPSTVYLYDGQTGDHVDVSLGLESDGRTITMTPSQPLQTSRTYYFYTQNVRDLAGNAYNSYRYFTTGLASDTQAPTITATSLRDAQTAVPRNASLQVRFSEPINALKLSGVVLRRGGNVVPAFTETSADLRTVTLRTVQPLAASTGYTLTIGGVEDLSANVLAVDRVIGFTTNGGSDLTAPTVTLRTPASGATNVARNVQPEVQLSELVNPVLVNTDVVRLYDGSTGQFVATTVTVLADGRTIRIAPAALLDANHVYYFYLGYSVYLEDLAGNRLSTSWTFTTGAQ